MDEFYTAGTSTLYVRCFVTFNQRERTDTEKSKKYRQFEVKVKKEESMQQLLIHRSN